MFQVYEHAGPLLDSLEDQLSGNGSKTYRFAVTAPSSSKTWQLNIHAFYFEDDKWVQGDIESVYLSIVAATAAPSVTIDYNFYLLIGLVSVFAAVTAYTVRKKAKSPSRTGEEISRVKEVKPKTEKVFDKEIRLDLTPKKAVVTITETDGKCNFLIEIPGTPSIKLKQEIKVDQDTKNELVREYEKVGVLANYLSLNRSGLNPPKPAQLLNLDMKAQLRELGVFSYRLLVPKRISDYLQANMELTHLWLEVDETLLEIPWELMYYEDEFLCMKYALGRRLLTEEESAAWSPEYGDRVGREKTRILFIGNPSEDLPESQQEMDMLYEDIRKLQKTEVTKRVGSEIDKKSFLTALITGFDVIHYAGHAMYDAKEPDKSYLRFKDGFCYAYEIRQFLHQSPPLLVFMNACSSAREGVVPVGKYETGIPSLARAFLYSGIRAYVGSIWPVHDASAAKFAIHFYRCLIEGHTIGDAMKSSRIEIYRRGADEEVAWSSFVLYGDPELRLIGPRFSESPRNTKHTML